MVGWSVHACAACVACSRSFSATGPIGFFAGIVDTLFVDLDQSLREIGMSDMSVGKSEADGKGVLRTAQCLSVRLEAAKSDDGEQLAGALHRNLYRGAANAKHESVPMAGYVLRQAAYLETLSTDEIISGNLRFEAA